MFRMTSENLISRGIYNYARATWQPVRVYSVIYQVTFRSGLNTWLFLQWTGFINAPHWPNLGSRQVTAHLLACIVRVLAADFPFISLWIRYYLLAPAYQSLFAACGLLCTGAYSLLQRRSVLLQGRGTNRARRPCFFFCYFPRAVLLGFDVYDVFFSCFRLRTPC